MKKLKNTLKRIGDWIVFLLTGKGRIANEMIDYDILSYEGQGRDKKGGQQMKLSCEVCGVSHEEYDLVCGVCFDCIDKHNKDIDMCYKIGKNHLDTVKLNCFLTNVFTTDEIEQILFNELKNCEKASPIDCEKFIEDDVFWFAEMLLEELEKEKK